MSRPAKVTLAVIGTLLALYVVNLVSHIHRDISTPMHCRCGSRPSLEL